MNVPEVLEEDGEMPPFHLPLSSSATEPKSDLQEGLRCRPADWKDMNCISLGTDRKIKENQVL